MIFPQPSSIGRAFNWTYTRLRIARILNWVESEILFPFLRAAQPTQIQSFFTNIRFFFKIRPFFKKRPSYSLPQSAEYLIEYIHDWELREYWIGLARDFVLLRAAQPIQVRSFSTNIWSSHSLSQLAEHLIKHTHDWELREY